MAKKTGKRIYTGNHPSPEKGELVAIFPHVWACYLTRHDRASGWLNFKLVANVPQPHKANFWLGLHVGESRWALTRDCQALANNAPVMAEAIMRLAGAIDADVENWRESVLRAWDTGFGSYPDWEVDLLPAWTSRPSEDVVTAQKAGRVMALRAGQPTGALLIWDDVEWALFGRAVRDAFRGVDNSNLLERVDFPF